MIQWIQEIYQPSQNYILTDKVWGHPLFVWINTLLFFILCLISVIGFIRQPQAKFLRSIARTILIIVFLVVICLQSLAQLTKTPLGLTYSESHLQLEQFAQFCHYHLPKTSQAKFLTDMNLSRDPGMLIHRLLAYELYPIDIRDIRNKEHNYLIFFFKKNAANLVPDGYRIIAQMGSMVLIAAKERAK